MCAVILALLSTMHLFRFKGHETATRKDLAIAWFPLVLLDWAIVQFLLGLMLWYVDKSDRWRYSLVAVGVVCLACHYHIDCSLDVAGHESQWRLRYRGTAESWRYSTGGQSRKHGEAVRGHI